LRKESCGACTRTAQPTQARTKKKGERGGGTGGESASLNKNQLRIAYSKGTNGRAIGLAREAQIMSIFGTDDCKSCFFSEFFPLLTTRQSEQGCAPSNV
jgi:hypothetical protein